MKSIDIYRHEKAQPFEAVFKQPGAILRGTPFWSWNNRLDIDQLKRQIDILGQMGLGGFHMHSRTGLGTEYLGDDFMAAVKACVEKAEADQLFAWLYDEDRWPSGAAGGIVTRDPQYRKRHLLFTLNPYAKGEAGAHTSSSAKGVRGGNGYLVGRYAVTLQDGCLANYRQLTEAEAAPEGATIWYAYVETGTPDPWFNGESYVDTLNPKAIERFIEVTHERYREVIGDHFGKTVPAIFTDEPQFTHKQTLTFAEAKMDLIIPWTDDLPESYRAAYGEEILASLPEIFWELPERQASRARYRYHDHVAERFAAAFADTCGRWCEQHGICLTGHMMEEPSLHSQTHALGEAMRSYRAFQLPGIDMLCDSREYNTAKQAQSAAHQYGCSGVLSELYGVTDWDFPFRGHKSQGDWQAALGVTVRVHHLSWVSMEGEAKRDYPASISYQSPWWQTYPVVEDHFARVNAALTRGKPLVRVGVVHPIESYWLSWGPGEQTWREREERQFTFSKLTDWLLFGQIDFDFICESLLPEQCPAQSGDQLQVGQMAYETVIVPPMRTIRGTTLERLESFATAGGTLIFAGEVPSLVDAVPSDRARKLAAQALQVAFTEATLLRQLEARRELDVRAPSGGSHASVLHQFRQEGATRYLFVCDTRPDGSHCSSKVRVRGEWAVDFLDTTSGEIRPLAGTIRNGWTEFPHVFHAHGHLLVRLTPGQPAEQAQLVREPLGGAALEAATVALLESPAPVTLSEPNCLLLDQAEWRLDEDPWHPREELLRLHNLARAERGLKPFSGHIVQPWAQTEPERVLGKLSLRFRFTSDVAVSGAKLAIERPGLEAIEVNGEAIAIEPDGWWVDEAIHTLPLPDLAPGDHELIIHYAFNQKMAVEWCYLLGDFGVVVSGREARLTDPVRQLAWGDITRQGLPFYTGNITWHCRFKGTGDALSLRVPQFDGTMVGVSLNGQARPAIAYAPYESHLGKPSGSMHKLDLTLYGNRFNAFGALHASLRQRWAGPGAWRTQGDTWSYEYNLRPLGIRIAPRVLKSGNA